MITLLFLNRWVGYAVGILVALVVVVFYGNCSVGELDFRFFMLDMFLGGVMAYSIGLLIESVSMLVYLRGLRNK